MIKWTHLASLWQKIAALGWEERLDVVFGPYGLWAVKPGLSQIGLDTGCGAQDKPGDMGTIRQTHMARPCASFAGPGWEERLDGHMRGL